MEKTILITGATDGIGLETARRLTTQGHNLILHGRSENKLKSMYEELKALEGSGTLERYRADLSQLNNVQQLAGDLMERHTHLDVIINNAGVFKVPNPISEDGLDVRFVVNTLAPYLLTKLLLPLLPSDGRVINLSSAAQAPVDLAALHGDRDLDDSQAYAQSKLAITMWSVHMARELGGDAPAIIAVNPASFLGSKMVKEAYGRAGHDLGVGAEILIRAALDDEFATASGKYFDNDSGRFASPHPDALNAAINRVLVQSLDSLLDRLTS